LLPLCGLEVDDRQSELRECRRDVADPGAADRRAEGEPDAGRSGDTYENRREAATRSPRMQQQAANEPDDEDPAAGPLQSLNELSADGEDDRTRLADPSCREPRRPRQTGQRAPGFGPVTLGERDAA
jgi:hypothetical protein